MSNNNLTVRKDEAQAILRTKVNQIELLTGDKKKASAYASAMMSMVGAKGLEDCSVDSIITTAFEIVQAGLNPNPLFNEAYVVPFYLKGVGKVAQLQIGTKGYVTLGYRAGWVFKTRPVYECDKFTVRLNDFDEVYDLVSNFEERNENNGNWVHKNLKGIVVLAKDSLGNTFKEFVSFDKLEKIRLKSQNQKSADSLSYIWNDWAVEMYQAKALKYVIKRLPISDNILEMISQDEKFEINSKVKELPKSNVDIPFGKKETIDDIVDVDIQEPHNRETGEVQS